MAREMLEAEAEKGNGWNSVHVDFSSGPELKTQSCHRKQHDQRPPLETQIPHAA